MCISVNETVGQPQFGRIIDLFSHTFGGYDSFIAKVKLYQTAIHSTELNMWHVPQQATDNTAYCFLDEISVPLIIANDNETHSIWFLNFKARS